MVTMYALSALTKKESLLKTLAYVYIYIYVRVYKTVNRKILPLTINIAMNFKKKKTKKRHKEKTYNFSTLHNVCLFVVQLNSLMCKLKNFDIIVCIYRYLYIYIYRRTYASNSISFMQVLQKQR